MHAQKQIGWKQSRRRRTFPVTCSLGTNRVPFCSLKRWFLRKFDPLMETFLECENHVSRATTWTRGRGKFGGNRFKESGRSSESYTSQKRLCDPFFTLCPKPIARFRWKHARLSLFRPQPHMLSFIQIDPSFRESLAKTSQRPSRSLR